jgi:hypothetical protein
MIPILIGVEFAVGATEKSQEHAVVGLGLTLIILPMFIAGRIRYSKLQGNPVGRRTARVAYIFHKGSGYAILLFAWWNCYTGLVRISPADSFFQLVVLSSFPLGYDIPIFGIIQHKIYWPYLGLVCLIFLVAEIRKRRLNGFFHMKKLQDVKAGKSIWDDEADADDTYDVMTMEKFLELTRLGSYLCIVDGRVLDIGGFMDHHPGGREMLLTVAGSDITDEVVGLRDIEGFIHAHSYFALQKMKSLVIAVLVDQGKHKQLDSIVLLAQNLLNKRSDSGLDTENPITPLGVNLKPFFRRGRILDVRFITPYNEISETNKPVVMLCLAIPSIRGSVAKGETILPSSCFKFRVVNPWGSTFEAYYTPVKLLAGKGAGRGSPKDNEEVYEFLISLRPGGQISKACLGWKVGNVLAVQGPSINPTVLESIASTDRSKIVTMFASGTGVAPMLQLIDFYSSPSRLNSAPLLFLVWVVKGAEHNYSEWIGLEEKAEQLRGKFRWIIVYSSSMKGGNEKSKHTSKRVSIYDEGDRGIKQSSSRQSLLPFTKSIDKESSSIIKEKRASVYTPTSQGFRLFKGNRVRLIDSIHNQDPGVFANRLAAESMDISDGDFWRAGVNKSMTIQMDQSLVSVLLKSIQSYYLCEDIRYPAADRMPSTKEETRDDSIGDDSSYIDRPGRYENEEASELSKTDTVEGGKEDGEEVAPAFKDSSLQLKAGAADMMFYVCGSPRFDSDIREWIGKNGIADDRILNFYGSPTVHI